MLRTFIIAEIGINHNGDINIAEKLIDCAADMGCDAVKFQKRTIDVVYEPEMLDESRKSPWGTTQREQKKGLEFSFEDYQHIDRYCEEKGIEWFASSWDIKSQFFLQQFDLKYNKIASPMMTHKKLLEVVAREGKHTFISTGMSSLLQIEKAVDIFQKNNCPFELMHCVSEYPPSYDKINLSLIPYFKNHFNCKVGYSGHESDIFTSLAAVSIGASSIERHITLDKTMYGSDQSCSLDIQEFTKLVGDIRNLELSIGNGRKAVTHEERKISNKLRRVDTL
tara:strand:+ start:311 stop:1150 length:840 start_codon:yes stop_codon:yes gene_type:complete